MIKEDYINFEELSLSHVLKMKNWGTHLDPLFRDYNFRFNTDEEAKDFLLQKTMLPINKYYAVTYSEEMIGFLGMKNINPITKSSTLGFVLNPSVINMGFGTVVLKKFMKFYFNDKKMKKMDLFVAGYNTRARKVYEKIGFKEIKKRLDLYPNGNNIDETSPEYENISDEFVRKGNILYNFIYKMEIKREDFEYWNSKLKKTK